MSLITQDTILPLSQILTCSPADTASQAKKALFSNIQKTTVFDYVYVIDAAGVLLGVISFKDLLQANENTIVGNIMQPKFSSSKLGNSIEYASNKAIKHGVTSLPVIHDNQRLIGVLDIQTILKTVHRELHTDLLRLSGINPKVHTHEHGHFLSSAETNILKSLTARTPWIIAGLFGGVVIAQVMYYFENILLTNVIYISFIPLLVYIANAVAVQAQTLYIREESHSNNLNTFRFLIRQLLESSILGTATFLAMVFISGILWSNWTAGMVVGVAMLLSIVLATAQAILTPYVLLKSNQDPAVGSGPFATLLQDFSSIMIYLLVIYFF